MTWLFAVLLGIRHANVRIAEMCIPSLCLGKTVTVVILQETPAYYFSFVFLCLVFFFFKRNRRRVFTDYINYKSGFIFWNDTSTFCCNVCLCLECGFIKSQGWNPLLVAAEWWLFKLQSWSCCCQGVWTCKFCFGSFLHSLCWLLDYKKVFLSVNTLHALILHIYLLLKLREFGMDWKGFL